MEPCFIMNDTCTPPLTGMPDFPNKVSSRGERVLLGLAQKQAVTVTRFHYALILGAGSSSVRKDFEAGKAMHQQPMRAQRIMGKMMTKPSSSSLPAVWMMPVGFNCKVVRWTAKRQISAHGRDSDSQFLSEFVNSCSGRPEILIFRMSVIISDGFVL